MVDIQSAAAEIRRGKKKEEERRRRRTNHSMKIYMVSLLHRADINMPSVRLSVMSQNISTYYQAIKVRWKIFAK